MTVVIRQAVVARAYTSAQVHLTVPAPISGRLPHARENSSVFVVNLNV